MFQFVAGPTDFHTEIQCMYQREAMWMSFTTKSSYAVKISVGGVNALTGTPQASVSQDKQDYLAIKKEGGKM